MLTLTIGEPEKTATQALAVARHLKVARGLFHAGPEKSLVKNDACEKHRFSQACVWVGWGAGGSTRSLPSVKITRLLHQRKTGRPTISPGCRVCVPHLIGQSGSQTRKEISIRDIQKGSHHREVVFTGEIEVLIPEFGLQLVVQAIVLHLQQQIPRLTHSHGSPRRVILCLDQIVDRTGSIGNPRTLADHSKQGSKLIFGRISGLNFIRDPTQKTHRLLNPEARDL